MKWKQQIEERFSEWKQVGISSCHEGSDDHGSTVEPPAPVHARCTVVEVQGSMDGDGPEHTQQKVAVAHCEDDAESDADENEQVEYFKLDATDDDGDYLCYSFTDVQNKELDADTTNVVAAQPFGRAQPLEILDENTACDGKGPDQADAGSTIQPSAETWAPDPGELRSTRRRRKRGKKKCKHKAEEDSEGDRLEAANTTKQHILQRTSILRQGRDDGLDRNMRLEPH